MRGRSRAAARQEQEAGSALIWSLLFVMIVAGMIVSHTTFMAANRRDADVRFRQKPLADSFARSGLTDALSWFRKQPVQPVTAFDPKLDPAGDPPLLETIDPTVGLVREFEIRGKLWGRYEVRRNEVLDISPQRSVPQAGSVWEVGGRGIVYEVVDPSRPFNAAPNRIVSITSLKTELRGVPLLLPTPAAVSVLDEKNIVLDNGSELDGGDKPAIVFRDPVPIGYTAPLDPDHDPADDLLARPVLSGTPISLSIATYDSSPEAVFSMRLDELRSIADHVVQGSTALSRPFRDDSIVFVSGDVLVPAGRRLRGRVLLIVDGNIYLAPDNDSDFEGLVYVTGAMVMKGRARFKGAIVARLFKIYADAEVVYDESVLQRLQGAVARYRMPRTLRDGGTDKED
jgi:hypothetical protein